MRISDWSSDVCSSDLHRHSCRLRRSDGIEGSPDGKPARNPLCRSPWPHGGIGNDGRRRQRIGEGRTLKTNTKGSLTGVGTGPGDPELLTLKAVRVLNEADVVAFFCKKGGNGNARAIVDAHIRPGTIEMPLVYPVTTETHKDGADYLEPIAGFFEQSAKDIAAHLDEGRNVAVLSEGDPLFYGSYMHLHVRLALRYQAEVVAGMPAISRSEESRVGEESVSTWRTRWSQDH